MGRMADMAGLFKFLTELLGEILRVDDVPLRECSPPNGAWASFGSNTYKQLPLCIWGKLRIFIAVSLQRVRTSVVAQGRWVYLIRIEVEGTSMHMK